MITPSRVLALAALATLWIPACKGSSEKEISSLRSELEAQRKLVEQTNTTLLEVKNSQIELEASINAMRPTEKVAVGTLTDSQQVKLLMMTKMRRLAENHYSISSELLNELISNPGGARLVPFIDNGKANGFKIFALGQDSLFSKLGFQNGDTVHSINGNALGSAEESLKTLGTFKDGTNSLSVELKRKGKPMTIRVDIERPL